MATRSTDRWDEETLNAFVDGELDAETASRIEHAMHWDLNVRAFVQKRRRLNGLLSREFSGIARTPMSCGLQQIADEAGRPPAAKGTGSRQWTRQLLSLAAGVAMLAIGFGAGYFAGETRVEKNVIAATSSRNELLREVRSVHNRTLERVPSGQRVTWTEDNAMAELIPVRTLQTQDNEYCREFKEILIIDGVKETRHGISCREGKENWRTRVLFNPPGRETTF